MSVDERAQFLERHREQKGKSFFNKDELLAYCMEDVSVLRQACCAFRNLFLKLVKMHPFSEAITILSICNVVLRNMFVKSDTSNYPESWLPWGIISLLRVINGWPIFDGLKTLFMPVMGGKSIWLGYIMQTLMGTVKTLIRSLII